MTVSTKKLNRKIKSAQLKYGMAFALPYFLSKFNEKNLDLSIKNCFILSFNNDIINTD